MLRGFLGNKIGMTQIFDNKGVVTPVTVVDCQHWFITQVKTNAKEGYSAIQVGKVKKKYQSQPFSLDWLADKKVYFSAIREIHLIDESSESNYTVGNPLQIADFNLQEGSEVDVSGMSIGKGFQGVVKRWGFGGGPSAHGSMFHRRPGASSHMRSRGRVIKGKRFPGQTGNRKVTVRGLVIVQINHERGFVLIKGSVPGKKNALLQVKVKR